MLEKQRARRWNLGLNLILVAFLIAGINTWINTVVDFQRQRMNLRISNSLKITILKKIMKLKTENKNRLAVKLLEKSPKSSKNS